VSLLTDDEMAELGLSDEGQAAEAVGMTFHRLPTLDRHVPERASTLTLAETLRSRLREGASIVVHCRVGIGRSSTLAAAVLILDGLEPSEARDRISAARGFPVPDTPAQLEFIDSLNRRHP
jgi:protein-tyrosine phosphatase